MAFKTDEEFAAQEAANKKKAEADFQRRNEEALADRRRILEEMGLPDDTPGATQKKATAAAEEADQANQADELQTGTTLTGATDSGAAQTGAAQTSAAQTGVTESRTAETGGAQTRVTESTRNPQSAIRNQQSANTQTTGKQAAPSGTGNKTA